MTIRKVLAIPGTTNNGVEKETKRQIDEAMRQLFDEGYRRFRFVRLLNTGDATRIAAYAA
jgi:hypothetical protein